MSDGSFPHKRPSTPDQAPPEEEPAGARVIEFPTDEVSQPGTAVPTGTWADEAEAAEVQAHDDAERLLRPAGVGEWTGGGEVVAFPSQPSPARARATSSEMLKATDRSPGDGPDGPASANAAPPKQRSSRPESGARPTQSPEPRREEVVRPKFLASELLQRDWTPPAPLRRTLRWGAVIVGVLGAVGVLTLGALAPDALALAVLFLLCAAAGVIPLKAPVRGMALATVGAAGAIGVGVAEQRTGTPLLLGCTILTASALFFRASHNRSRFARTLVGVGLAATAGWLVLTGGLDAIVVASLDWQAWLRPVSRLILALTATLTLLTFLDPTSPGGAWVAGGAMLAWLVLDVAVGGLLASFPLRGADHIAEAGWAVRAALPLFAMIAAGGLSQVWVTLSLRVRRTSKS